MFGGSRMKERWAGDLPGGEGLAVVLLEVVSAQSCVASFLPLTYLLVRANMQMFVRMDIPLC
jgi:hypothetical protein